MAEIVDTCRRCSWSHLEQVGDPQSESEAGQPRSFAVTNSNGRFTATAHNSVIDMTRFEPDFYSLFLVVKYLRIYMAHLSTCTSNTIERSAL